MKNVLYTAITEVLSLENPIDFVVEEPANASFGDYSTNVALILAKSEKKNPREVADRIASLLNDAHIDGVEKIEIAGAGFINFFVTSSAVSTALSYIKEGKNLPQNLSSKKYIIEHTQPNPFKEFHIGHLMNNAIGESIGRLVKTLGAQVKTASYHGDKGLHVAKAVWALKNGIDMEKAYAYGNKMYEEDAVIQQEITEINKKIYEGSDEEIQKLYHQGMELFVADFKKNTERLGSQFDYMFFESRSGEIGKEMVHAHTPGVFEKSEGAVVFRGENFLPKTHTRVFLNKDDIPTYEAKELGLAKIKRDTFEYDESITITGNEQDSFFKVVEVAIGEVFPELKGKLHHLSHGMLRLPEGKMSSRTGNIITALGLIRDVTETIKGKMADRNLPQDKMDEIAEKVALGAIKYSILKQAIGGDIVFDMNTSLSFEGDSGPYLQYSAVRAQSILRKAHELGISSDHTTPSSWQTRAIEKKLLHFYETIERAGLQHAPQLIATYLVQLAGEYNAFYAQEKIIDASSKESQYKLFITEVFKETMISGLWLLGIQTPEEM